MPGGFFLVLAWIDTKLDPEMLQIFVDKTGRKIVKRSRRPNAQMTAQNLLQLFETYSWAKNEQHVAVSLLQEELNQIHAWQAGLQNEWHEEVLCYLDEEVVRSTVDIDGNHTNQIEAATDEYGRQFISFFLRAVHPSTLSSPVELRSKRKSRQSTGSVIASKYNADKGSSDATDTDNEISRLQAEFNGMGSLLQKLVFEMQQMQIEQ